MRRLDRGGQRAYLFLIGPHERGGQTELENGS